MAWLPTVSSDARPRVRTATQLPVRLVDGIVSDGTIYSFDGLCDSKEHIALRLGVPCTKAPLVRIHSECLTGDAFGSARCDCGPQLAESLCRLHDDGGYLLYLRQEGRGIGLYQKIDAYRLQDDGHTTFSANRALGYADDDRDYTVAAEMLRALGIPRIRLLTNNPDKRRQLEALGILIVDVVPTGVFVSEHNWRYLDAKVRHADHTIRLPSATLVR